MRINTTSWNFAACLATLIAGLVTFSSASQASPDRWRLEGWKTDFSKKSVEWIEVLSGGPPRDGIPSIDNPKFVSIKGHKDLTATEPVIGLEINGEARAYPLRILTWHEIVNDVIGGTPVAVTYCPLCNAAIVFDRRLDGEVLEFGTSGKLRNSDLIMYDRQTQSWWQQFTGEAIAGSLTGKELKMLPARLEAYERFVARHPDGEVLVPTNPNMRAYGRNPYGGYDSSAFPFLYRGEVPEGISPMARVVVVENAGKPTAVSLELLRNKGRMAVGETTLTWEKGQNSALDSSSIARGRDVGNVVAQRKAADGTMTDVRYDVTFAFVFHAFHPESEIIKG
ncbi:MAG: DUF3179 domain-containing protein [Hyphomicrobiaceae bacterium]